MKRENYISLITIFIVLYLGLLAIGFFGHTQKFKVQLNKTENKLQLPLAPEGTHKATIKLCGNIDCDVTVQMLKYESVYNSKTYKVGKLNDVLFENDWYGDSLGLIISDSSCINNSIKVKLTYFDM